MKKLILFVPIIFLIIATTVTKNSTKKIDKKIFEIKENIRALEEKYELVLLDFNYLTSPKKLIEYQRIYFDNELIQIEIKDLNRIEFLKNELKIEEIAIND